MKKSEEEQTEQIARDIWRWAAQVARDYAKWSKNIRQWIPKKTKRNVGRPHIKWLDDIQRVAGKNCILATQDRQISLKEAHVQ
ncbi:hypothetical protein JTB14_003405 [Gonioctena quinquepunctata]|nr:hypothetical protein JTB14_003405 [Gonioctena quinquepunctata]